MFFVLIDLLIISKIIFVDFDHRARADDARGRARGPSAGHESRGLRHTAPLGVGTLAARMGPAHQNSDRRASSDALLIFSRRRGRFAARSMARHEQLRIAVTAAVLL